MSKTDPTHSSTEPAKRSRARTVSLGAAILAVPISTAWLYHILEQADDREAQAMEAGARYDLAALAKIDPVLIRYREVLRIDSGMQAPRAMCVDAAGQVLIAGDQLIRILSATGEQVREILLNGSPNCIATTSDGKVLVGMLDHVEVFAPDGSRSASWPVFGTGSFLTGLAVAGDDVYIADSGRRVVLRCSMDGRVEAELGKADPDRDIPGLVVPSAHLHVAVGGDGLVWISNPGRHRLEAYSRDGALQRYFGSAGGGIEQFLGCCNPSNFALLADGRIVTAEKGIPRVKVYLSDGRLDCVVVGPDAFGKDITGIRLAADQAGRVLVLEAGTTEVRIFARSS